MPRTVRNATTSGRTVTFRASVGRAIRRWREGANLTREQLASRLGVAVRTLQRWEEGSITPRLEVIDTMERIHPGIAKAVFPQKGDKLLKKFRSGAKRR